MPSSETQTGPIDWGAGRYEKTAEILEPVGCQVVRAAGVVPGTRVLDVACGTGNAALAAAEISQSVIGVDLAPRLIEVARTRAERSGHAIDFVVGDATALPVADESVDAVLSVFGVIFAPAEPTLAELVRVLAPGGCVAFTVWQSRGAVYDAGQLLGAAFACAAGLEVPAPQPWADPAALTPLLARHGLVASVSEHSLVQRGESLEAWVAGNVESHPWWRSAAARLEPAAFDAVLAETTEIAREANEDSTGFALTMDYRLIVARRTGRPRPGRLAPRRAGEPPFKRA